MLVRCRMRGAHCHHVSIPTCEMRAWLVPKARDCIAGSGSDTWKRIPADVVAADAHNTSLRALMSVTQPVTKQ